MANYEHDISYLYIHRKTFEKDYDVKSLGISIFNIRISHYLFIFLKR